MAFAIDTVDGRGLSNEVRRELLPKKSKIMLYLHGKSCLTSCTLLTRRSALVYMRVCRAGYGAYKRRLAYSVTERISA